MGSSTEYPYRTIVYITDVIGGQGFQGSGVLLSPDEVLTASHLLYRSGVGAASSVRVSPGYDGGFAPYGTVSASYFHYFAINDAFGILSNATSQTDYAIIHLSRPFNVGFMGYQANFAGGAVQTGGYPASGGGTQVDISETVTRDPVLTLLDGVDTGSGSSGSPLWVTQNGLPSVVGLVSSGTGVQGFNTLITTSVFQTIQGWISQDDYADPLVDAPFYLARNPDVAASILSAAYHYDTFGWHEGRDPSAYFSTLGYLGANPDVRAAGVNPLGHYDAHGWQEGRDPAADFDTTLYLLHNPDVARANADPLLHFLQHGRAEGRAAYAAIGPAASITAGFDPEYYLLANPDVGAAGIDAWTHFDTFGWREGRNPNAIFDTRGYLNAYPDVARAGLDPLTHYDQYGWTEGRDPAAGFDTKTYLRINADVAAARIDPLEHYLQYGVYEGRSTFADGRFG